MKAELKEGDRALVPVELLAPDERRPDWLHVQFCSGASIWIWHEGVIPIPAPLPAPNCEGMWLHLRVGCATVWARNIEKQNGMFGFYLNGSVWTFCTEGTWHGPVDPRLLGVEVEEEPKPKSLGRDECVLLLHSAIAKSESSVAEMRAMLTRIVESPAQPGDET